MTIFELFTQDHLSMLILCNRLLLVGCYNETYLYQVHQEEHLLQDRLEGVGPMYLMVSVVKTHLCYQATDYMMCMNLHRDLRLKKTI